MRRLVLSASVLIMGVLFCNAAFALEITPEGKTGAVTGLMMIKGDGPLSEGTVFFFDEASGPPPSATRYWRVPTNAFRVARNGSFKATLPEGNYYMGAIRRLSKEVLGPPQEGDYFFISQDEKGKPRVHTVKKNETLDLGIIAEAVPFRRETLAREGITSIEGTILDDKGKPAAGVSVFAFSTPMMVGRPLFVSERSGKDGSYLLRLYEGGVYYLKARVTYEGGPPSTDQIMGVYRDGQPLTVKTGDAVKGVDIRVGKVGVAERAQ